MSTAKPVFLAAPQTGLTAGFGDILANWDKVLKALDNVNEFTAAKCGESPVGLADACKHSRPSLWKEASSSNPNRPPPIGYPEGSHNDATETSSSSAQPLDEASMVSSRTRSAEASDVQQVGSLRMHALLVRLGSHLGREADRGLLADALASWHQAARESREQANALAFQKEQDLATRLRLARALRCKAALEYWQQAGLREVTAECFSAWCHDSKSSRETAAVQTSSPTEQQRRTEDISILAVASQELEMMELRSKLVAAESSRDAAQARVAAIEGRAAAAIEELGGVEAQFRATQAEFGQARVELRSVRIELCEATSELSKNKVELQTAEQQATSAERQSAVAKKEVQQLRASSTVEVAAAARRDVSDLTVRLARSEADNAEARGEARRWKVEVDKFQGAFSHGRGELELVYGVLAGLEGNHQDAVKGLKGTIRDREVALAHLYHLLETFRAPLAPVAVDEGLRRSPSSRSASTMSPEASKMQSSLSLPSLG
ncbi:unnamed protein product, partial [Polarella glacialis]